MLKINIDVANNIPCGDADSVGDGTSAAGIALVVDSRDTDFLGLEPADAFSDLVGRIVRLRVLDKHEFIADFCGA